MVGSYTSYFHHDKNNRLNQKFVVTSKLNNNFNLKRFIYTFEKRFKFCIIVSYYWLFYITLIIILLFNNCCWSLSEESYSVTTTTTVPKSSPIQRHKKYHLHHDPIISNVNDSSSTTPINSNGTEINLENIVVQKSNKSTKSNSMKSKSRKKKKNKKAKKKKKILKQQRHTQLSNHDDEMIDKSLLSSDIQYDVTSLSKTNEKEKNIVANNNVIQNNDGKKKMNIKTTSSILKKQSTIHQMTAMRRIQREWKDIIDAGIAFDWVYGRPQQSKSKRMKRQNVETRNNSYIWLGPLSKQYWWIWHFTFAGLPGSVYGNGVYHGRIQINPKNYPSTPPSIQIYTQSGRFICHYDICLLTASNYHPELWLPSSWTIRTIVEAVRLHMITLPNEIGSMNDSYEKRLFYANKSRSYLKRIIIAHNKGKSSKDKNGKNNVSTKVTITIDHQKMIENGWITSTNDVSSSSSSLLNDNVNTINSEHTIILNDEQRILENDNDTEEIHTNNSSSYHQYVITTKEKEINDSFMISNAKSFLSKNETVSETTINLAPPKGLPFTSSRSSHTLNKRVIKKKLKSIQQYYESISNNNSTTTATTTNEINVNEEYYESNHHKSTVVFRHDNLYATTNSKTNNHILPKQEKRRVHRKHSNKNKYVSLSMSSFISVLSFHIQKNLHTIVIALLCWYLLKPLMY